MKNVLLVGLLALCSVASYAKTNPRGPGMYCALDAEAQAKIHAKANGASPSDLKMAETVSLDPEQGIVFKTTIGAQEFYIVEVAKDGVCVTEFVKEL